VRRSRSSVSATPRRPRVPVSRCSASCSTRSCGRQHRRPPSRDEEGRCRARSGAREAGFDHAAHRVRCAGVHPHEGGGGRHTPFFSNYHPQFYFRTTDVTGTIALPEGTEMVMPGDNTEMQVTLGSRSPWKKVYGSPSVRVAAPSAPAESSRSTSRDTQTWQLPRWPEDSHSAPGVRPRSDRPVDEEDRRTVIRTQAKVRGPVPLPTEIRKYCVIRSPHKHKDSREHFEMRIHKRLLDIVEPTAKPWNRSSASTSRPASTSRSKSSSSNPSIGGLAVRRVHR